MENQIICPIIIPAYEPDERLLILLADLNQAKVCPVIIVDDGSSEAYRHIFVSAEEIYHAVVLKHEKNYGKGRGLKTAFTFCLKQYAAMVGCITADSDGQHTLASILKCREALFANPRKLILGVRDFTGDTIPLKSSFGNQLTRKVFHILYKVDISDTQTGLRGIPAAYMQRLLDVPGDGFEFETRMLIDAIEKSIGWTEVQIETIYDSKENHGTHFRPIVDSVRIYRVFGFGFGKFAFTGVFSSAIDLLLFQLVCLALRNNKFFAGVYVAVATVGARAISSVSNYLLNYFLVFASKRKHYQSAVRYFLLAVLQVSISAALTTGLFNLLSADVELFVKIPVDILLWFFSFQIQKRYVY